MERTFQKPRELISTNAKRPEVRFSPTLFAFYFKVCISYLKTDIEV